MNALDFLPGHWAKAPVVAGQQEGMEAQLSALRTAAAETLAQLNVQTATWALADWERAYGIPTDPGKSQEDRRARIISKMRGQGTTTVALIRAVAESFSNGAVEVTEYPAQYRFEVKFVGTIGVPPRMEDLTVAISDIKPAHLDYAYIIRYRTWAEVKRKTWAQLKTSTWADIKGGIL